MESYRFFSASFRVKSSRKKAEPKDPAFDEELIDVIIFSLVQIRFSLQRRKGRGEIILCLAVRGRQTKMSFLLDAMSVYEQNHQGMGLLIQSPGTG
jgi:hypothetical protein